MGKSMRALIILIIFSLVHKNECAKIKNAGANLRIIGGEIARASQFPYAAAIISTYSTGSFFCGGVIISNQWVLTAAQCIAGATQLTIQMGSNRLDGEDVQRVTVATSTYTIHSEYNDQTLENDLALIRLRLPVDFNTYISAVNLPLVALSDEATVTTIGWGQESDSNPGLMSNLHYVQLYTITNADCRSLYYGSQITDDMVCAVGQNLEGICTGDSGGPLIEYRTDRDAVLVGIASFHSSDGCERPTPSGFTRTYPFVDWIRNITGITK